MKMLARVALTLVVVMAIAASAVGQPAERGVTATEIIVGTTMPLSGGASLWGLPISGAMDAWFKKINDEGGIQGRKLRLVVKDDGYLPPRAVANTREMVERDGVFALVSSLGTANVFAVRDYVIETQTLWITPLASTDIWAGFRNKKYLFVTYPGYTDEGAFLTKYAVENLKAQKIAVFYQNDLYGQQGLLGVKRGFAQLKGVKLVAQVSYEVTDREVTAQAQKLKESGADTVVIYALPTAGALIVREMAKLSFRPTLVSSFTLADPIMFALAGEAWNNVYLGAYFPLPGTDTRVDAVLATLSRINPALARSPFNAVAGVAFVEAFLEGLRRTGPNLTKDRLVASMETLKNWDGEVIRQVNFGPDRRQGTNRLYMTKVENGKYIKLTDWYSYPTKF
jgi:ABC-type branched-subunit amino acid transport system substrate-binding protein